MLKLAVIQLRTPATPTAALAHAAPLVRRAAKAGAKLVITPEATNLLERNRARLLFQLVGEEDDEVVVGLRDLARELSIWLVIGSALVKRDDGKAANRSFLIAPDGKIAATYDKMHMFDVDLPTGERHRESAVYEPGVRAVMAKAAGVTLGLTICYDLRFPSLYSVLARSGAQLFTVPSAFTRPTGEAHWEVLLRARAIENGAFVAAAAQGGLHEDGRATWGRSMIIGPWGKIVARAEDDEPGVILANIDLAEVAKARSAIPALENARPFIGP
jgi:predicted amidohydrolase